VLEDSGIALIPPRVITEGDMVVLHNTYENAQALGADTLVAFDVFRVEDGQVVEHWDNLQVPPTETVSGRSMTDGPTEVVDLELTAQNKTVVEGFIADVLQGAAPQRPSRDMQGRTISSTTPTWPMAKMDSSLTSRRWPQTTPAKEST
jgi:hypothetical protein